MNALKERIEPFDAMMFDRVRAGDLRNLVAPPYDLIGRARQDELYERSPYNIVRLELNRDADPYASAAETLARWRRDGIVTRLERPAIYLYTQKFELDGIERQRNGLIARIRLEEFASGRILPHERTFPKAKEDRLRLLTATRLNVSPIFGLYRSSDVMKRLIGEVRSRPPMLEVTDDLRITNEIRAIDSGDEIATIQRAFADTRVLIADGHHRYETALEYRRRMRAAENNPAAIRPYDYVMMTLVEFDDPGLVILPTHRIARRLDSDAIASFESRADENFAIERFKSYEAMRLALAQRGRGALGVALQNGGPARILSLANPAALTAVMPDLPPAVRELDVSILHTMILDSIFGIGPEEVRKGDNIEYTIDARAALADVESRKAAGVFLMNPPSVEDVERVCNAGATMPEKSTYFHPKLLTGLVMNPAGDDDF